jgi:hypothetical protein
MRQKFQKNFLHFDFDAALKKNALLKRKKKKTCCRRRKKILLARKQTKTEIG